ncbi:ribosome silencing factor [Staphylococcus xylosus]|uniref:Ribosomal silencing factor RsfS n=1 Tax=Staphylococcus xylosus TaxID=1288 RepID=A0A939NBT4_STAXY|nr:ribosome silencing factor [Staphylococcus xylosus]
MKSDQLLKLAVEATENKKAEDIISLNMKGISDMTDYFVVCHGNNENRFNQLHVQLKTSLTKQKLKLSVWKLNEARWILIDLANVVVHVFHKDERDYYNIEKLYRDAPLESYRQVVY